MAAITVTKASGEQEPFDEVKLRRMLVATGADSKVIDQVIKDIEDKLYDGISTQRITEEAFRQLPKKSENIRFDKIPTEHEPPSDFDSERLDRLQRHAFDYFLHETNPNNGLVADNSQLGAQASIASVGFALGVYVVGVERGWMSRSDAIRRTLSILHFFWTSEQSPAPNATGHKGFYYHFLDMDTGKRAGKCELSTIDTGILQEKGFDYFENSRRATYVQQEYAIRNPLDFQGYGKNFWGITASDGPGWTIKNINGIERSFFGYVARDAPYGPDDGTVAPWAVVASLPFAPEIVLPTIQNFQDVYPQITGKYCLRCSFNLSYSNTQKTHDGWTSSYHYGINLGPVILMIENYRSELIWKLMRDSKYIVKGLKNAGFKNGWL